MSDRHDDSTGDDWGDDERARIAEVEALLAELDVDDLEQVVVPGEVWQGVERELAQPAAPVVELAQHRRRATTWLAAAAAVVLVIGGVIVALSRDGEEADVLSTAELSFDPASFDPVGADAAAVAELISRDGELAIRLIDAQLPDVEGEDLELWLIEPDASGSPVDVAPVSILDDGDIYVLPPGLDPESHFVVDISVEPRDGDAAHSGRSILRGPLEQA